MDDDILRTAAHWHGVQDRDDMDWDAFTRWLEADPRHREAFDGLVLLDLDVAELRAREASRPNAFDASDPVPPRPPRRLWFAAVGAAAAAAALVIVLSPGRQPRLADARWEAGSSPLVVALGGGSNATLGPRSVLSRTDGDARYRLVGRGFFQVRHDPSRPLTVEAGGYEVRDIGTRFDVVEATGALEVDVAEGRVDVSANGARGAIMVSAGQSLVVGSGETQGRLGALIPTSVGAWRDGALRYDGTPLSIVAADLSRRGDRSVIVSPATGRRVFTGVLARGDQAAMLAALEQLTGLHARIEGNKVRLVAGD